MRKLIENVSAIINNLETIKLVEAENVTSSIFLDSDGDVEKYVLNVRLEVSSVVLYLILEMFQDFCREEGFMLAIAEKNVDDPDHSVLCIDFYE